LVVILRKNRQRHAGALPRVGCAPAQWAQIAGEKKPVYRVSDAMRPAAPVALAVPAKFLMADAESPPIRL
jgi:hypothetical protein